ncbi:unnamed protein product [Candidula unifasciata]|uniref:Uncharacterized protein n=1 Tax=Candidula unifasciata TaxID=100452 RepID=A0A8S4A1A0_9EUPU|nr:unnamed protein product [Candidula unifasciata]
MDQAQLCIFVVLTFSCLTRLVTPIPMVTVAKLDYDTKLPVPITEDVFDLKDEKDLYDPTSVLLTRFRRNLAQWMTGSQHFNQGNNRRFAHRQRFNSRHVSGQVVDA